MAAGITVSAASAAISSFDGLRSLALLAGWTPLTAVLLPLTIDSLAVSATRVWLSDSTTATKPKRFARRVSVGALLASILGNAMYHAVAVGLVEMSWFVVVIVGGVPPASLGLIAHLAAVTKQSEPAVPHQSVPGTALVPADGTRYRSGDELLTAARAADVRHRAEHGRPISRDALRKELRIGAGRTTEVLRRLRAENHSAQQETS